MRLIDADALIAEYPDDVLTHCDIEAAPTISPENPQPQWIPVTERLPVENGNYIVTACYDIWNSTVVMVAEYYSGSRTWYDECCECSLEGIVTHWLPLPEPYNPAEEEGNT